MSRQTARLVAAPLRKVIEMDFLTGLPYWGIFVLALINALIVWRMKVDIGKED